MARYIGRDTFATVLKCPSDDGTRTHPYGSDPAYIYSYTLNIYLTGYQYAFARTSTLGQINNPSTKIMFVDEDERSINDGGFWGNGDQLSIRHDRMRVLPDTFQVANDNFRGNVNFCDGHAESVSRVYVNTSANYLP